LQIEDWVLGNGCRVEAIEDFRLQIEDWVWVTGVGCWVEAIEDFSLQIGVTRPRHPSPDTQSQSEICNLQSEMPVDADKH
jgi:hypothetical protein